MSDCRSIKKVWCTHIMIEYVPAAILLLKVFFGCHLSRNYHILFCIIAVIWIRYCMLILDALGLVRLIFGMELIKGIERTFASDGEMQPLLGAVA